MLTCMPDIYGRNQFHDARNEISHSGNALRAFETVTFSYVITSCRLEYEVARTEMFHKTFHYGRLQLIQDARHEYIHNGQSARSEI